MTVALLGATGLIGSGIAGRLEGHPLRRLGRAGAEATLDLCAAEFDPGVFAGCDALVHAAGITDEDLAENPAQAWSRATAGTTRLLQAARSAGISRVVYVSSAHVYGPLEGDITEARPANPMGEYGLAHFAAEQLLRRAARSDGLDVLILRPCAVYGLLADPARFRRWSLIPFSFPRDLLRTGRIVLKSDGEQRRNFVSAEAIGAEVATFLADPALPGRCRVQNAVGADDMTVHAFAELCVHTLAPLMGAPGRVERPAPLPGPKPAPLVYRSGYTSADTRSTLIDTIRALAASLSP